MSIELYKDPHHVCLMFNDLIDSSESEAVQANQFLIVTDGIGAVIDPAGQMTYNALIVAMGKFFPFKNLRYIFASHQDPDIVASLNRWLFSTEATLYVSSLWSRFVPHFCTGGRTEGRIAAIPDKGLRVELGNTSLYAVPAHFLHAEGNFQFYDERSKILFSGDMGASLVHPDEVRTPIRTKADFAAALKHMEGFHKRYMVSNKACRLWANMVRGMDVEKMVPQHPGILKVARPSMPSSTGSRSWNAASTCSPRTTTAFRLRLEFFPERRRSTPGPGPAAWPPHLS